MPDEIKVARVIPIFKGEDKQLVSTYFCTAIFPQIFEKIVATCVIDFLDDNMVFYKCKFGFRKNHSIGYAIITLVERVSKALDTGKYVVGVFLDLKKGL